MLQFWQNLQHYLEHNFNVTPVTAATIIISLLVFFLGFLVRGIINWAGKMRERWIVRHLFTDNLKGLKNQIERQTNGLAETAKSLDMQANSVWVFHKATLFQVSVFKEMKYGDSFRASFLGLENYFSFLRGLGHRLKKRKSFYKVWENNANLEFWSDKMFKDFDKYLDSFNEKLDAWNDATSTLRLTWAEFIRKHRSKQLTDKELEFGSKLQTILATYANSGSANEQESIKPFNIHTNLVRPIKKLSEDYERSVDTQDLIETSLKSVNAYIELDTFVKNVRSQVEAYKDMMNDMLISTDEAIKNLS